jgi:hypothetical protein
MPLSFEPFGKCQALSPLTAAGKLQHNVMSAEPVMHVVPILRAIDRIKCVWPRTLSPRQLAAFARPAINAVTEPGVEMVLVSRSPLVALLPPPE